MYNIIEALKKIGGLRPLPQWPSGLHSPVISLNMNERKREHNFPPLYDIYIAEDF